MDRRTALYDAHVALSGKMVEFAGWQMPVQYQSVIAEAKSVREGAGMFDVSHMARLWIQGDRALEFLEHVTTNDVSELGDGEGQYSLLPNSTGGLVDDIIVYRISDGVFRMVVNASNHAKDWEWLTRQNSFGVQLSDETDDTAMIAVQGPGVAEIMARLCDTPGSLEMPFFGTANVKIGGVDCFAPRSGYTGEDGFELICSANDAERLWNVLLDSGVKPCGLAARDTLRVEAGLPLYGHELSDSLSPIAAGLGWVISKTKSFIGSEAINRARAEGTTTKLQGIRLDSKRVASPDMDVYVDSKPVGKVSSGVFSPLLDCGIAFAFVDASIPLKVPCEVEIRGKMEPGTLVGKRFFKRDK